MMCCCDDVSLVQAVSCYMTYCLDRKVLFCDIFSSWFEDVRTLEDLRCFLRACRQLGSRMKKSVVFVDVAGSVCVYSFVGGRRVSW